MRRLLAQRPSVWMLWAVAVVIAAAIAGYSFLPRHEPRDDVAGYIREANDTGDAFNAQYKEVASAYRGVAGGKTPAAARERQLQVAAARLTELRRRLEAIDAPEQAVPLRRRLVAFYRRQEAVAHELAQITVFFDHLAVAERGLGPASARMRARLGTATTAGAQAAALRDYVTAVGRARARVAQIEPGASVRALRSAELQRLARTRRSVSAVSASLEAGDRAALQRAVKGLGSAGAGGAGATRAVILKYNRDVKDLNRLAAAVEQERVALDRSL